MEAALAQPGLGSVCCQGGPPARPGAPLAKPEPRLELLAAGRAAGEGAAGSLIAGPVGLGL